MIVSKALRNIGAPRRRTEGFTLIEVMIVVVVVAILAAIAYPSYQNYVRKARRSDGKDALLRVQIEEEKWRTNNTTYTSTLSNLGIASNSTEGYYTIAVTIPTAAPCNTTPLGTVCFTATATATSKGNQNADSSCGTLTLSISAGGESKTPSSCW